MADKDQFTFEDDDDFPETDLSSAFSDGEHEAQSVRPEVQDEHDAESLMSEAPEEHDAGILPPLVADEPQKGKRAGDSGGSGGSRTRVLLLLLLLVAAGAAGAYYFMGLGETTPSVPTVPAPVQTAKKSVALPPPPAEAPPVPTKAETARESVKVAVPAPPAETAAKPVTPPAIAEQPVQGEPSSASPAEKSVSPEAKESAQAVVPAAEEVSKVPEEPVSEKAEMATPSAKPDVPVKSAPPPKQVADGNFALDAGSYLFESNRDNLIAKIKSLGYEPLVTPVDATLDMTRLRLGTFNKDEVQEALDFARTIEPAAYSSPAGDTYVIYAGTFLGKGSIDKLVKRFQAEGVKVYPEPVQVVRTLSRIRFGRFATMEDATTAAMAATEAGVQAVVVKTK